jgi:hypothetical protein
MPRDWRLKPFHLNRQEEQDFHVSMRRVVALTCAYLPDGMSLSCFDLRPRPGSEMISDGQVHQRPF